MKRINRKIKFAIAEKEISSLTKGYGTVSMFVSFILLCTALWSWYEYSNALVVVKSRADSLELSGGDATVKVLSDPEPITIGQNYSKVKIVELLQQREYSEINDTNVTGTFWFDESENALQIVPRYPEFPHLKIKFKADKIISLQNIKTGGKLQTAEIEPRVLGSYLSGENDLGAIIHEKVTFNDLKDSNFLKALLVVENRDFFEEQNGISWKGTGRAFLETLACIPKAILREECSYSGGSTLTQQLVKNMFLTQERTFSRKYREFWLTVALERYLGSKTQNSKERIFELYVNNTVLSAAILPDSAERKIVGFPALAKYLYGKSIFELSPQEAVTLACLSKSPNGYLKRDADGNLVKINKLLTRRDKFLDDLHESNPERYSTEIIESAKAEEIKFNFDWQRDPLDKASATFSALTKKEVESLFKTKNQSIKGEPIRIYTEADPQALMENHQILREQLPKFAERIEAADSTDLKIAGSIILYDAKKGNFLSINSLELEDGTFHLSRHAFDSTGQIMSVIKSFIYSYGLDKKKITLTEKLNPATCRMSGWSPDESDLRTLTFGQHLASSNNLAPLCILQKVGLNDFEFWWRNISGKSAPNDYKIANGLSPEANLSSVELARLFGLFAAQGKLRDSRTISQIYIGGQEFALPVQNEIQAVKPKTAQTVANQLQAVVNINAPDGKFGTAEYLYNNAGFQHTGIKLLGKTGSGAMDFWFAGVKESGKESVVIVIRLTAKTKAGESIPTQSVFASDTAAKVAEEVLKRTKIGNVK